MFVVTVNKHNVALGNWLNSTSLAYLFHFIFIASVDRGRLNYAIEYPCYKFFLSTSPNLVSLGISYSGLNESIYTRYKDVIIKYYYSYILVLIRFTCVGVCF